MAANFIRAAKEETWKVRVLADTRAAQRSVSAGEIIDLSVEDALDLLRSGKAERYVEPSKSAVQEKIEAAKPPVNAEVKTDDAGKEKSKEKPTDATKGGNK